MTLRRGELTGKHFIFLEDYATRVPKTPVRIVIAEAGEIGELYFDPNCVTGLVPLKISGERYVQVYWKQVRRLSHLEELALAFSDPEAS